MSTTFQSLKIDLRSGKLAPIYLLHGEEGLYTDLLLEEFDKLIPEEEKTFNFFTFYAIEKDPDDIIDIARRFPMMSSRLVVVIKEVQSAKGGGGKWVNRLAKYAVNPNPSTVLVISARGAKIACKEFTDAAKKSGGVVLEFAKMKDDQLPSLVSGMLKHTGLAYDNKVVGMLVNNIGNDLSRLYNEIEKLKIVIPQGGTITPESVEKNIGISREYNNFELTNALSKREAEKAIKIIRHLNSNQRETPWVLTLSAIYSLFAGALAAYYSDRTDSGIATAISTRYPKALYSTKEVMRNYSPAQLIEIIHAIRQTDTMAKGIGSRMPAETLMESLVLKILFCR